MSVINNEFSHNSGDHDTFAGLVRQVLAADEKLRMSYARYLEKHNDSRQEEVGDDIETVRGLFLELIDRAFEDFGSSTFEGIVKEISTLIVQIDDQHSILLSEYSKNVAKVSPASTHRRIRDVSGCIIDANDDEPTTNIYRVKQHLAEHFQEVFESDGEVIESVLEKADQALSRIAIRETLSVTKITVGVAGGIILANKIARVLGR